MPPDSRKIETFQAGVKVLDHGYVKLVDYMGSDEFIVESARMSTSKGFERWDAGWLCDRCSNTMTDSDGPASCPNCEAPMRKVPGDAKMLDFMYRNKHATPFEFGQLVVEVQAPIMVFREWHRHRTQCLAGATEIWLQSPRGTTYKRTIKEIFDLKYGGVIDQAPEKTKNGYSKAGTPVLRDARRKDPWRTRILPNCQERLVRTLNEKTGRYGTSAMADVWESGMKELYEVRSEFGLAVRVSAEHPFLTRDGWAKVKDLRKGDVLTTCGKVALRERPIPPRLRQGIGVWTTMMRARLIKQPDDTCFFCKRDFPAEQLELDHVIPVSVDLRRALDEQNLKPVCKRCHRIKTDQEQPDREGQTGLGARYVRLAAKPVRVSEEQTYDMEMRGPDHNYLANGLVVHNSYSEMSARYVQMPDLHYLPAAERIQVQSKSNKQGGAESFPVDEAQIILDDFASEQGLVYTHYNNLVERGLAKEVARLNTPVSRYSRMRASADLRCWLAFLLLRKKPTAQWEIRQFADVVADVIAAVWPRTYALFEEYDFGGVNISRTEVKALREVLFAAGIRTEVTTSDAHRKIVDLIKRLDAVA